MLGIFFFRYTLYIHIAQKVVFFYHSYCISRRKQRFSARHGHNWK